MKQFLQKHFTHFLLLSLFLGIGLFVTKPEIPQVFAAEGNIHNMGYGPSDVQRIEALIKNLYQNRSPLSGHGADVLSFAKEFNIDPLIIILMTNESQMCSDISAVSPNPNDSLPDNYNCGGIPWETTFRTLSTQEIDRWSARQGPWANNRYFTFVPTPKDGLGLFFNYLGISSKTIYKDVDILEFYDIYNPCSDSDAYGYACGAEHMRVMLDSLERNAGPASTSNGSFVGDPLGSGQGAAPGPGVGKGRIATSCVYVRVGNPVGPVPLCDDLPVASGAATPLPPVPDGDYQRAMKETFNITVEDGLSTEFEKVMWEFMGSVGNTKFSTLIKGATVHITPPCPSYEVDYACGTFQGPGKEISIRSNVETADLVKLLFAHEMGHVIWHHNGEESAHQTEHMNALTKEGGVTIYGDDPCYKRGDAYARQTEDYAEMIAYHLNPFLPEQTSCATRSYNPFADGKFPLHKKVAESILGKV